MGSVPFMKGLLTRFEVYALAEVTEEEAQLGILQGTFPKPDFLLFGHQSRWRRSTILRYLKEERQRKRGCHEHQ